jgi:hypothetical protein
MRNGKIALRCTSWLSDELLTEIFGKCVFICQTGGIHDSRGRLLVRIGKVTVVRRPLQSMVCSGRLTICDQKTPDKRVRRIRLAPTVRQTHSCRWDATNSVTIQQSNDRP